MTNLPTPEVVRINARVFAAGLKMRDVLKRASVSRAKWWRMSKGEDFLFSTLSALDGAIDALISEKDESIG